MDKPSKTFQMSRECGLVARALVFVSVSELLLLSFVAALGKGLKTCFLDWEIKWKLTFFFGSLLVGVDSSVRERDREAVSVP